MKIHEYQGKQLFAKYGVPIPKGIPAFTVDEATAAAKRLSEETKSPITVIKAQIHAGGRGKGGGVKVAKTLEEATAYAKQILGMQLVTPQTGPAGKKVGRLYVEQGLDIARELYLALLVDRDARRICVIASTEGGMEIEKVAEEHPEKILKVWIEPAVGFSPHIARELGFGLGLHGKNELPHFVRMLDRLYECFVKEDCSLVEVNPLVVRKNGEIVALDAKINFDDNAEFRHREWLELLDETEEDPVELEAKKAGLNYVSLDGDIGCLVNGAGLAMSTMDVIQLAGAHPANFLDVGGGATEQQVTKAFSMILQSPKVKGIFVNIFGGIMRCDVIANGVVAAARGLDIKVPVVVRLEGTNVELGKKILSESGMKLIPADTISDGAAKIVAAIKGA